MLNERPPNAASGASAEQGRRFGIPFCILLTLCAISLGSLAIHRHFDVEPYFTIGLVAAAVVIGLTGFVRWVRSGARRSPREELETKVE